MTCGNTTGCSKMKKVKEIIISDVVFKNISIFEWLIYLIVIFIAISSLGIQTRWWFLQKIYPADFTIYYNAANGNYPDSRMENINRSYVFSVDFQLFLLLLCFFQPEGLIDDKQDRRFH